MSGKLGTLPTNFKSNPTLGINNVRSRFLGLLGNCWIRYCSYSNEQGNLFRFFIKPKLSIEYDADLNFHEETAVHKTNQMSSYALRRFLTLTVRNKGRGIAKDCSAMLRVIPSKTTAKTMPSGQDKRLVWENQTHYITIGAKKGKARLNIVFSQDDFKHPQFKSRGAGYVPEQEKVYAKVSTNNSVSFTSLSSSFIGFPEDGLGIGDTYFSLLVNTIDGYFTEAKFKIKVTDNWQDISLEMID
jgi:hypothetical protein